MTKLISIDAETDGLWGNPFWIAAIVYDNNGKELEKINLALENPEIEEEWVEENVLPHLQEASNVEFVDSYEELLKKFSKFYMEHKEETTTLWHMGHVVESHLFREMHRFEFIENWDAPYTPIEVAEVLRLHGHKPDSVDDYIESKGLEISDYGSTHNPLYDCEVAAKVYYDLM